MPGQAFYNDGSGELLVRFWLAKDIKILDEACQRVENLKKY